MNCIFKRLYFLILSQSSCFLCFYFADMGDIQSRLLDHRPVVNAEIRYFVKEFEVLHGQLRPFLYHTVIFISIGRLKKTHCHHYAVYTVIKQALKRNDRKQATQCNTVWLRHKICCSFSMTFHEVQTFKMIAAMISEVHVLCFTLLCCKGQAWPQGKQAARKHQQNAAGNKRANAVAKYWGHGPTAVWGQ